MTADNTIGDSTGFYNRISCFYPLINVFLGSHKKILFKELEKNHAGKLLDIGVGCGAHLHRYGNHEVTGIDSSEAMLKAASKNATKRHVLLKMHGEDMEFGDACFDYIVIAHTIAVARDPEKMLEEAFRVLKPGGRLYVLNHFTPAGMLKYLDRLIRPYAKLFYFRSYFFIEDVNMFDKFRLEKVYDLGYFNYYKLLILQKP